MGSATCESAQQGSAAADPYQWKTSLPHFLSNLVLQSISASAAFFLRFRSLQILLPCCGVVMLLPCPAYACFLPLQLSYSVVVVFCSSTHIVVFYSSSVDVVFLCLCLPSFSLVLLFLCPMPMIAFPTARPPLWRCYRSQMLQMLLPGSRNYERERVQHQQGSNNERAREHRR